MESENKRLKVLIVILLVFLIAFGAYYFCEKVLLVDDKENPNEVINDIITSEKEYTKEELLALLDGVWYVKIPSQGTFLFTFINQDNHFSAGKYHTGGGIYGEIKSMTLLQNSKYELIVHDLGCQGEECMFEYEPTDYSIFVDTKNISNKSVDISLKEITGSSDYINVKYLAKTVEEAYNKLEAME